MRGKSWAGDGQGDVGRIEVFQFSGDPSVNTNSGVVAGLWFWRSLRCTFYVSWTYTQTSATEAAVLRREQNGKG